MVNNTSKKHRKPSKRLNKSKKINKSKKTGKRVKGGCSCNTPLFKGGSNQVTLFNSNHSIPFNTQTGSSNDPLAHSNYTNARLLTQHPITPNLLGGERKRTKSKKIKGGNLLHNLNNGVDVNMNTAFSNIFKQGYVSLPQPYKLA